MHPLGEHMAEEQRKAALLRPGSAGQGCEGRGDVEQELQREYIKV